MDLHHAKSVNKFKISVPSPQTECLLASHFTQQLPSCTAGKVTALFFFLGLTFNESFKFLLSGIHVILKMPSEIMHNYLSKKKQKTLKSRKYNIA